MAQNQLNKFVETGKKIAGAGLNYKALLSQRNLPVPTEPVIFLKPSSSYITEGHAIEIPKGSEVHHEIELGVIIGQKCKNISESSALKYIGGYCLALDMTEVKILQECRSKGLPWTFGKGFDTACPVSRFVGIKDIPNPDDVNIWLKVNGKMQQNSSTSDMVFSVGALISYISKFMTLEPGDLILTGSPAGVGPVVPGDVIEGGLGNILTMKFPVKLAT